MDVVDLDAVSLFLSKLNVEHLLVISFKEKVRRT